jgi:hypothetical protein
MRLSSVFASWLAILFFSNAGTTPSNGETEKPGATQKETALDALLSERGSEDAFHQAIEQARAAGVSQQAILEARFLFHVDRREDSAIAALLPAFIEQNKTFDITQSAIFGVKEDWLAVVEYVQAIHALENGDHAAFKTHITEAFWLSPRQASAFAPHIDRLRLELAMSQVTIDFNTRLIPMNGGDAVSLESLMKDHQAMLLHFWSPESSESEASLPDYITTATTLEGKGIAMVSILPDGSLQTLQAARAMIQPLGLKPPGQWLVEGPENTISQTLRVQTLPLFALVSNKGKVLFNGEPYDPLLWQKLSEINPAIRRPRTAADAE